MRVVDDRATQIERLFAPYAMPPSSYDLIGPLILPSASDAGRVWSNANRRTARAYAPAFRMVTREQRLRGAVETSVGRLAEASGGHDEQVMFETLGECLTWVCALDELLESHELLESRAGYKSRRNTDSDGGFLQGLRHARNAIVHGDAVVDAVDADTDPTPRVTMASGAGTGSHSRVITPPSRIQWTFTRTLPPPGNPARVLEAAYAAIADKEVLVPIQSAINWLDRELAATR